MLLGPQSPISTSKRDKTFNNPAVDVARLSLGNTYTLRHFDNNNPRSCQNYNPSCFVKYRKMGAERRRGGNLLLWYVCCVSGFTSCRLCLFFLLLITFFPLSLGWLYTCLLCFVACGRVWFGNVEWRVGRGRVKSLVDSSVSPASWYVDAIMDERTFP